MKLANDYGIAKNDNAILDNISFYNSRLPVGRYGLCLHDKICESSIADYRCSDFSIYFDLYSFNAVRECLPSICNTVTITVSPDIGGIGV